jgi:hypothetical protein
MKAQQQPTITPDEARAISKEAYYIYGFPPVDSYRICRGTTAASERILVADDVQPSREIACRIRSTAI